MKRLFPGLAAVALDAFGQNATGSEAGPQFSAEVPGRHNDCFFPISSPHNASRLFQVGGSHVDCQSRGVRGAGLEALRETLRRHGCGST